MTIVVLKSAVIEPQHFIEVSIARGNGCATLIVVLSGLFVRSEDVVKDVHCILQSTHVAVHFRCGDLAMVGVVT